MQENQKQLEICPKRRNYIQGAQQRAQDVSATCVFCDPANLEKNYILTECPECDVRLMLNLTPTLPLHRGRHLVVMPRSHEKDPNKIAIKQVKAECDEILGLAHRLHSDAFSQEYFTNIGPGGGQSVPNHFHRQFKSFEKEPLSLSEMLEEAKSATITIQQAFEQMKKKMEAPIEIFKADEESLPRLDCLCCCTGGSGSINDEKNLVVARLKHNYICLTQYPVLPGEIAVVPHRHVSSIKDLTAEEFYENMIVATALIPHLMEYANKKIRECTGANLSTIGMGNKASEKKKQRHHLYTLVMPRTTIAATPGTLEGNSCKLDENVPSFYKFAKKRMPAVRARLEDKG